METKPEFLKNYIGTHDHNIMDYTALQFLIDCYIYENHFTSISLIKFIYSVTWSLPVNLYNKYNEKYATR